MKSLRTSLQVFLAFSENEKDFSVAELAAQLGYNRSHVSKIADALVASGLLLQDEETRRFAVGPEAFAVGSRFVNFDRLSNEAMGVMRPLARSTGYGARLCIPRPGRMLYVASVEGARYVDYGWQAGKWLSMHSTSSGRVALAFMAPALAEEALSKPLARFTEATIINRQVLKRLMAKVRESGFSTVRNESILGLGAIAVPVFGKAQRLIGTINLAFPSRMVSVDDEPALVAALHAAATELSLKMGCPVYPFGSQQPAMGSLVMSSEP